MKHIEVVAAVIMHGNKILCMQRKENRLEYISKKYEFPGGKVEIGESNIAALMRELKEEMDIDVSIEEKDFLLTVKHQYPDFHILMHAYLCHPKTDVFSMKDHIAYKWLFKEELKTLDWAMADIPIVEKLMEIDNE